MLFSCKLQHEPSTPCVYSFGHKPLVNFLFRIFGVPYMNISQLPQKKSLLMLFNDDLIGFFLIRFHSIDSWVLFILW